MGESLFSIMAKIAPERSVARSGGDLGGVLFSGYRPEDGTFFAGGADESCGQGASVDQDGESALIMYSLGESCNVPAEIMEERWPVIMEKYELWQDSGGAGRFRGGLGVRKQLKALTDLKLIGTIEQTHAPAWGVDGGQNGSANAMIIAAGEPHERRIGKVSGAMLRAGERLLIQMGGGGGWGHPFERDAERVLSDVTAGYVSNESAIRDYGVAVVGDPGSLSIDRSATQKLRGR